MFRSEHPEFHISFSKFYTLIPKYCISAGNSQTHSVCVCTYHQNAKLLIDAAGISESYHELINILVCHSATKECHLMKCCSCPNTCDLKEYLQEHFQDRTNPIVFREWQCTDRTELVQKTASVSEFISLFTLKMTQLVRHAFVASEQSSFFKMRKDNLDEFSVIAILYFSENFTFRVQDEIQSSCWSLNCCIVHPVLIYFLNEDKMLDHYCLCFLSDDLRHDVPFLHMVQKEVCA